MNNLHNKEERIEGGLRDDLRMKVIHTLEGVSGDIWCDCEPLNRVINEVFDRLLSSQREADRQRMVERVEKPSEIRTAKAASKEEDNFDFGYDVKTKEILSLLSPNTKEE